MLLFALLELFVLHETALDQALKRHTYVFLERFHPHPATDGRGSRFNVQIVDISKILPTFTGKDDQEPATSLLILSNLVARVALQGPACIGIDIDLSPTDEGGEPPEGFHGFTNLLERLAVPVFLGVNRTVEEGPGGWLYDIAMAKRAAWIGVLPGYEYRIPIRLMNLPPEAAGGEPQGDEAFILPSMTLALARAYSERHGPASRSQAFEALATDPESRLPGPVWFLAHLVAENREHLDDSDAAVDFATSDLSVIERLKSTALVCDPDGALDDSAGHSLSNKIVLLGDIGRAVDRFNTPGSHLPQPGVLLHGAGAATLTTQPLFELDHLVGTLLGVVVLTTGLLFFARLQHGNPARGLKHSVRTAILLHIGWGAGASVLAFILIFAFDILWLELLMVWEVLLVHLVVEILATTFFPEHHTQTATNLAQA